MTEWDKLSPEQQVSISAQRRRVHGSVAGETALRIEDERAALLRDIIAWLQERGHGAAANDLNDHWWAE